MLSEAHVTASLGQQRKQVLLKLSKVLTLRKVAQATNVVA